jgi:putative resolvase
MTTTVGIVEAARLLQVHPNTLRRWEASGAIVAGRTPGGHRRYPLSEINRLRLQMGMDLLGAEIVPRYTRIVSHE